MATATAANLPTELSLEELTRQRNSEQGQLSGLETELGTLETKLAQARENYKQECRQLLDGKTGNPQKARTGIDVMEVQLEDLKSEIARRQAALGQLNEAYSQAFRKQQEERDSARLVELNGLIAEQDTKLQRIDEQYARERSAAVEVRVNLWTERTDILQRRQTPVAAPTKISGNVMW